ncbi:MAG TPA: ATP-binding protein, partial [Agromyces sp.]
MSRVLFMCGPAGSGKSTIARRFEAEGMVRLSFDVEAWRRGIRSMPLAPDVHAEIETELQSRLRRAIEQGRDVVLDFSFWSRQDRDRYRALVRSEGIEPETVYVATPRDVVVRRVLARGAEHADDFPLDEALAGAY